MEESKKQRILEWRDIWSDNSDYTNTDKGIIRFAKTLYPDDTYNETPPVHLRMYRNLLQLFNPRYRFLEERQLQLTLPRGISKSTITNLFFISYVVCFNGLKIKIPDWDIANDCFYSDTIFEVEIDKSFIVLISETSAIAETWIRRLKGEFAKNRWIRQVFGNMKEQAIKDDDGKWTQTALGFIKDATNKEGYIIPDWQRGKNTYVVAKGSGMQMRGINIKGRPDLEIWDDMYSLYNTKTEESRHKIRYFATAEAKDGIDPIKGAVVSLATIVHEDTIPVDNEKSKFWTTIKEPIMDLGLFKEVLANYCTVDYDRGILNYPDRAVLKDLEKKGYTTIWPDRISLEMLVVKLAEKMETKTVSMFYQEYFHIVIAEEDKEIKPEMFQVKPIELVEKNIGGTWYSFAKHLDNEGKEVYHNVNLALGTDSATSYKTRADNSAIIYVGKDYYNRLYIFLNKSGKYAFNDEIETIEDRKEYAMKLCLDRTKIKRIGSGDEMFRIVHNTHHRPLFIIETNNAGGELAKQIKAKMQNYGMQYQYIEVYQTSNKIERILDTLKPYYQSRSVIHNIGQDILQHELEYLGKTTNDDNADILASCVMNLRKPTIEINYNTQATVDKKYTPPSWLSIGKSDNSKAHPDWVIS